jgi:peroxiredoxin
MNESTRAFLPQARKIKVGGLIPSFRLPAVNAAGKINPWDYRQHQNLVLFLFREPACQPCLRLLRELAADYEEYRQLNAEILVVISSDLEQLTQLQNDLNLPFPVLSDPEASVLESYAEEGKGTLPDFGVLITDRWGAIFSKTISSEIKDLPAEGEIRDWLSFIEIQCSECFPPEPWPGD